MKRIVIMVSLAAAFMAGRWSVSAFDAGAERVGDVRVTERVVTRRDTVRIVQPAGARREPGGRIAEVRVPATALRDTVRDTVTVVAPAEIRVYEGEDYRAQVSGIDVRLDTLELFPVTRTVVTRPARRWGPGITLGLGVDVKGRISPSITVGLTLKL